MRNKELAVGFRDGIAGASSMTGFARIFPILRFAFFSVKVVRHTVGLWMAVEKGRAPRGTVSKAYEVFCADDVSFSG